MKTTLDLPDDLFVEAEAVAAQQGVTFCELFTKALEKEIRSLPAAAEQFEIDRSVKPFLARKPKVGDVDTNNFVDRRREPEKRYDQ